ncbi:hypothetical protein ACC758_40050, partial [Rhizobium ruizarguesonis]
LAIGNVRWQQSVFRPKLGQIFDDRQKVRALAYAIAMDIHPICNMHVVSHHMNVTEKPDAREEWMKHFIHSIFGAIE